MKAIALTTLALAACATAQPNEEAPTEFGRVAWQRTLEPALADSTKTGKPVWLQFQEVPG